MKVTKWLTTLLFTVLFSVSLYAVDFTVGVKGGYSIWKPYFEDIGSFFEKIDRGTGVLYGPVVSVIFTEDISVSLVGFTGEQSTFWSLDFEEESSPDDVRAANYTWKSDRYDIDAAISYRLLPSLKVFAGYKYQNMSSIMKYTEVRRDSAGQMDQIYHTKIKMKSLSNGPALGLGYSLLFGKGFFASVNLSGIYMKGSLDFIPDFDYSYNSSTNTFDYYQSNSVNVKLRQMGTNLEPSLGYMPEGSSMIFTLGFRYQWLSTEFYGATEKEKEIFGTKTMNDYLYGIFVSVLYSF